MAQLQHPVKVVVGPRLTVERNAVLLLLKEVTHCQVNKNYSPCLVGLEEFEFF